MVGAWGVNFRASLIRVVGIAACGRIQSFQPSRTDYVHGEARGLGLGLFFDIAGIRQARERTNRGGTDNGATNVSRYLQSLQKLNLTLRYATHLDAPRSYTLHTTSFHNIR